MARSGGRSDRGAANAVYQLGLERVGVRAKALPARARATRPARSAPTCTPLAGVPALRLAILGSILRALEPVPTHDERMRLLAAVASLHDDPDEAAHFLRVSVNDEAGRCARCGRAHGLSRWRNG